MVGPKFSCKDGSPNNQILLLYSIDHWREASNVQKLHIHELKLVIKGWNLIHLQCFAGGGARSDDLTGLAQDASCFVEVLITTRVQIKHF